MEVQVVRWRTQQLNQNHQRWWHLVSITHPQPRQLNNGSTKTYYFAVTKKLFPSIKPQKNTWWIYLGFWVQTYVSCSMKIRAFPSISSNEASSNKSSTKTSLLLFLAQGLEGLRQNRKMFEKKARLGKGWCVFFFNVMAGLNQSTTPSVFSFRLSSYSPRNHFRYTPEV